MTKITRRTAIAALAAAPFAVNAASHAKHEVVIQGFAFKPANLKVKAGDAVRFVNADSAPHTATAKDGSFDTGRLKKGQSIEVQIPKGSHDFFCKFHPKMVGKITAS